MHSPSPAPISSRHPCSVVASVHPSSLPPPDPTSSSAATRHPTSPPCVGPAKASSSTPTLQTTPHKSTLTESHSHRPTITDQLVRVNQPQSHMNTQAPGLMHTHAQTRSAPTIRARVCPDDAGRARRGPCQDEGGARPPGRARAGKAASRVCTDRNSLGLHTFPPHHLHRSRLASHHQRCLQGRLDPHWSCKTSSSSSSSC